MAKTAERTQRTRRRHRLVTELLDDVDRHGLAALTDWHGAIAREYGDDDLGGLLTDIECRWQRVFDARLDGPLENDAAHLQEAVVHLWDTMSEELSGTRLLLDAYAGHPALVRAQTRHRRMLAAVTGVNVDDLPTDKSQPRPSNGETHGREHRPRRVIPGHLRVRPVCRRLHRRPVPAA
jgi:hypothetical protein